MEKGSGTHPAVLAAVICATATILAGLLPRLWDRYVPAQPQPEAAPAALPVPTGLQPVLGVGDSAGGTIPVESTDPLRDAWGTAIARMSHSNLGVLTNQLSERIDTQGEGYPELQREDRDADGFFEIYRVDLDGDNTTDYWFQVDPTTGQVYGVTGPR